MFSFLQSLADSPEERLCQVVVEILKYLDIKEVLGLPLSQEQPFMSGCAAQYLLERVRGTGQAWASVQRLVEKLKVRMLQWSKSQSNPF